MAVKGYKPYDNYYFDNGNTNYVNKNKNTYFKNTQTEEWQKAVDEAIKIGKEKKENVKDLDELTKEYIKKRNIELQKGLLNSYWSTNDYSINDADTTNDLGSKDPNDNLVGDEWQTFKNDYAPSDIDWTAPYTTTPYAPAKSVEPLSLYKPFMTKWTAYSYDLLKIQGSLNTYNSDIEAVLDIVDIVVNATRDKPDKVFDCNFMCVFGKYIAWDVQLVEIELIDYFPRLRFYISRYLDKNRRLQFSVTPNGGWDNIEYKYTQYVISLRYPDCLRGIPQPTEKNDNGREMKRRIKL